MKKVIIDTSIWIENERKGVPALADLLRQNRVLMHWTVYGELAVGQIKNRSSFLSDLRLLESCETSSPEETFETIEKEKLFGTGLSLVDCLIFVSARKCNALVFSLDQKLNTFHSS